MRPLSGILNVNKPSGCTSRDVVNSVQRLVRPNKVGHAGTLDPLARGVLLVCVGQATRLVPYIQQQEKRYIGTFLLGRTSNTEDIEGKVTVFEGAKRPKRSDFSVMLPRFRGEITQRPPAFSALKVKGRRAYDLARRGELVELAERPVTIYRLELLSYEYPEFVLDITCGSGTYIRSLGRDIAESLGSGAVMSALERVSIGSFLADDTVPIEQVTLDSIGTLLQPPALAVSHLHQVALDARQVDSVLHGRVVSVGPAQGDGRDGDEVAGKDGDGRLIAILTHVGGHDFKPTRVFPPPE